MLKSKLPPRGLFDYNVYRYSYVSFEIEQIIMLNQRWSEIEPED